MTELERLRRRLSDEILQASEKKHHIIFGNTGIPITATGSSMRPPEWGSGHDQTGSSPSTGKRAHNIFSLIP